MTDFIMNLDKNIVIKLLTEFVPFETSGHETKKDYDEWIKKGIKKWSSMPSNTLLGKIFNKDYKNNYINKTEINKSTNKYFFIPDIEELNETDSPINLMEESTSRLFDGIDIIDDIYDYSLTDDDSNNNLFDSDIEDSLNVDDFINDFFE